MINRESYIRSVYSVKPKRVKTVIVDEPLLSQDDAQVLCPLNEFGYPSDVLQRALSSDNDSLRQSLLSQLSTVTSVDNSHFKSLDDNTLLDLCKLRTCQTLGEVKRYVKALGDYFDANNIPVDSSIENSSDVVDVDNSDSTDVS